MYDLIYIGGGLNYAGAIIAARAGKKVALIERTMNQIGGICLHKGCIPSKMFLHQSELLFKARNPIIKGELEIDMPLLVEKKEKLLKRAAEAVRMQCEQSGIELIEGEARIIEPHKVQVADQVLEGASIIIGTGSRPFIPEGIAYNGVDIISSDEVLQLQALPQSIAIYGSGAIGLEMASFFATAGVETTLIYRGDTIQPKAHEGIQKALLEQLDMLGVKRMELHTIKSAKSGKRGVSIHFETGKAVTVPMLLVASGRKPNLEVVDTDAISCSRAIDTDATFETTLKGHYAIGDCNGKVALAHAARAEALFVTNRILGRAPKPLNIDHVVKFIHALPMSYAAVGVTKSVLVSQKIAYKERLIRLNQFTYSAYNDASKGLMVSYADEEGFILGAEVFAPNAEELIAPVAMALAGEMDAAQAKETILAHPTFSEALERTFFRL